MVDWKVGDRVYVYSPHADEVRENGWGTIEGFKMDHHYVCVIMDKPYIEDGIACNDRTTYDGYLFRSREDGELSASSGL